MGPPVPAAEADPWVVGLSVEAVDDPLSAAPPTPPTPRTASGREMTALTLTCGVAEDKVRPRQIHSSDYCLSGEGGGGVIRCSKLAPTQHCDVTQSRRAVHTPNHSTPLREYSPSCLPISWLRIPFHSWMCGFCHSTLRRRGEGEQVCGIAPCAVHVCFAGRRGSVGSPRSASPGHVSGVGPAPQAVPTPGASRRRASVEDILAMSANVHEGERSVDALFTTCS